MHKKLPKRTVSIITVTYNAVQLLEDTIKSVISQNFDDIEYIIIDGGSTDGTLKIIKKYSEFIDYWISERDKGIYDAMNKGIKASHGEIIHLLNAGDRYASDDVVRSFSEKIIQDPDCQWAYGLVGLINEKKDKPIIIGRKKLNRYVEHCHQGFFYRKKLHEQFGYYDTSYIIAADHYFMLKIYNLGKYKPFFINKLAVYYQLGGKSDQRRLALIEEKRAQDEVLGKSICNTLRYFTKSLSYRIRKGFENIKFLHPILKIIRKVKHI